MKTCRSCSRELSADSFYKRTEGTLRGECKDCWRIKCADSYQRRKPQVAQRQKTYYETHKEQYAAAQHRRRLKQRYDLSPEDYDAMLEEQGGVCKACGRPCPTGNRLAVDHCHKTGKIGGLLCVNCNKAAGHLYDDPELCLALAAYLRSVR